MNHPKRVNYKLAIQLVQVFDIIAGIALFLILKTWLPDIEVILPKALYESYNTPYWIELTIFVLFWFILISTSGLYRQLKDKGFIQYYTNFAMILFLGHIAFTFFFFTKNEFLYIYGFYHFFIQQFAFLLLVFSIPRFFYFNIIYWSMKKQKTAIYALLIGDSDKAKSVYNDFEGYGKLLNHYFLGYISTDTNENKLSQLPIDQLGNITDLQSIIDQFDFDEVIVALNNGESNNIQKILNIVKQKDTVIRILPDMNAILEGTVKTNNVKGIPLITIKNDLMPVWQSMLKKGFDIIGSLFALSLCIPFIPFIIVGILFSSKGPIFYTQTRIGKSRKPFKMIKFRSMYIDAEHKGPSLSSTKDPRITPFGRIMRKWHIDELPQFINVLIGDMSIVGPRPERKHFINQILPKAPYYAHLFRIKPGITSWGMVKYGYAENITQMIERLKYDILYLENMTLLVDLKIVIHTLKSVLVGDGK